MSRRTNSITIPSVSVLLLRLLKSKAKFIIRYAKVPLRAKERNPTSVYGQQKNNPNWLEVEAPKSSVGRDFVGPNQQRAPPNPYIGVS
ncbi:hypothetical protein ACH5RR_025866 [Cinchona calisaya]|uniref:Uncharacterized protein n=1 Tax=Cinchona calisaya TaxID=153742 RepID=A0ABD2Z0W7_9GENT